mmetsp:Transcript_28376/g.67256  ORF Transcript_28376/g.67256 Transcript_28376/m.67256 type:complete len:231 (-) Transcript_28376:82-774(-)
MFSAAGSFHPNSAPRFNAAIAALRSPVMHALRRAKLDRSARGVMSTSASSASLLKLSHIFCTHPDIAPSSSSVASLPAPAASSTARTSGGAPFFRSSPTAFASATNLGSGGDGLSSSSSFCAAFSLFSSFSFCASCSRSSACCCSSAMRRCSSRRSKAGGLCPQRCWFNQRLRLDSVKRPGPVRGAFLTSFGSISPPFCRRNCLAHEGSIFLHFFCRVDFRASLAMCTSS